MLSSILSLLLRFAACLFSHQQTHRLPILTLSDSLPSILTRRLTVYYSLTLTQARCLSILTLSGFCLSVLTPSGLLPVYSHTSRLTAYLFSHYQTHCHLFSLHQARCLSILTLSGLLSSILTRSGSLSIYSHTQVTVYLFSHPMLLRHSCSSSPMYSCTLGLTTYVFSYSTSHLSSPTPRYLVPTIRFAAYLALVCCLVIARLTTNVLSCLSIVLVLTHPHTQTCCLSSCTSSNSICALSDPILHYQTCLPNLALTPRAYLFLHTLSGLLPMFSQACSLDILRFTAYLFSGSLPMYSQAHCLSSLRLTAYVVSGSLPMYSQVHCLCILRFTAYVFSGSLPM